RRGGPRAGLRAGLPCWRRRPRVGRRTVGFTRPRVGQKLPSREPSLLCGHSQSSPLLRKAFDDTGTGQRAPYVPFEMPEDLARTLRPIEELSGAGEPPGGGMRPETAFEPPPDETGPYGQRPAFRKYPGLGE